MKKMNRKGFTIVELVIVIAVIAILAAVLIPTFSGIVDKANNSSVIQETRAALTVLLVEENGQVDTTAKYYFIHADGKNVKYFEYVDGEIEEVKNTAVTGWNNAGDYANDPKIVPDNNDAVWYAKGDDTALEAAFDAKYVTLNNKVELADLKNIVIYKSIAGGANEVITDANCPEKANHNPTEACEICGFKCTVKQSAITAVDNKCTTCGKDKAAHPEQ